MAGRSQTFAWLGSSFVPAGLAATIVGSYEASRSASTIAELVVMLGFVQLLMWPFAIATSCVVRGLGAAWQPRRRVAALVEPDGTAPALFGWILAIGVGIALLAFGMNVTIWAFSRYTAFKVRSLAYLLPVISVGIVLAIIAFVPVVATAATFVARRVDRRLAKRSRTPVLTARRIVGTLAALIVGGLVVVWLLILGPFLAHVDLHEVYLGLLLLAVLVVAQLVWIRARGGVRKTLAVAGLAIPVVTMLVSLAVRIFSPSLILTVWGRGGLSADGIELLFDVYEVRNDVPASSLVPTPRADAPHRSILLITIDTIRPDRTSTYGGPVPTPALTKLAAEGTMFAWAFAPANVTRRSLPSLITGLTPPRVRGRVAGWALKMDPRHVTLAERLRAGGYKTIGLFCCEGFWGRSRKLGLGRGIDDLVIERDGQLLVDAFKARLKDMRGPAPTFTWIHFIELHRWAEGNENRDRYDHLLSRVDEYVGQLVTSIAMLPEDKRPIVIVTGDHSEALGEHGQPYHSTDLYNSQIRIPLIIAGPGVVTAGSAEVVSLVDVAPTILDLAGFLPPTAPMMDGRSLADFLRGERASDPSRGFAYAAMIVDRYVRSAARALVSEHWKLIKRGDQVELYDLRTDPNERKNLAQAQPDIVRTLLGKLHVREEQDRVLPF